MAFISGKAFAIERIDGIYRLKEPSKKAKRIEGYIKKGQNMIRKRR